MEKLYGANLSYEFLLLKIKKGCPEKSDARHMPLEAYFGKVIKSAPLFFCLANKTNNLSHRKQNIRFSSQTLNFNRGLKVQKSAKNVTPVI